jgi:signal transduction histidine kinase
LNLVNNSLKYRKPNINPHVFIHSRITTGRETMLQIEEEDMEKEFVSIEVSDNGIGFDQHDSEKIFNVFTRLHNNKEYAGSGIGLAIANRVMENHSGYIFSRGVKGQGATFTLLFPT